jgi:hypothetical protein
MSCPRIYLEITDLAILEGLKYNAAAREYRAQLSDIKKTEPGQQVRAGITHRLTIEEYCKANQLQEEKIRKLLPVFPYSRKDLPQAA